MKIKFLIIILFILPLFAQSQQTLNISADIRGHACGGGFGLCSHSKIVERSNSSFLATKKAENVVTFTFDMASLTPQNQQSMVGREFAKIVQNEKIDFQQGADLELDAATFAKLGFDAKYAIIKKGSYPMEISRDKVVVSFTVSEKP